MCEAHALSQCCHGLVVKSRMPSTYPCASKRGACSSDMLFQWAWLKAMRSEKTTSWLALVQLSIVGKTTPVLNMVFPGNIFCWRQKDGCSSHWHFLMRYHISCPLRGIQSKFLGSSTWSLVRILGPYSTRALSNEI